jgi:hypothetical protein
MLDHKTEQCVQIPRGGRSSNRLQEIDDVQQGKDAVGLPSSDAQ